MPTLYPAVVTPLTPAATTTSKTTAYITTPDAYGIKPEQYWLGSIADQINITAKSGKRYTDVEDYKVTPNNSAAITGAGYTLAASPAPLVDQQRISW